MLKITNVLVKDNIMSMDIVAPIYWWMDFDSTNLAIDCEGCPIGYRDFTIEDFSYENVEHMSSLLETIGILNSLRHEYESTNNPETKKSILMEIVKLLPLSYNWEKLNVIIDINKALKVTESKRGNVYSEWELFEIFLKREIIPYIQIKIPISSS